MNAYLIYVAESIRPQVLNASNPTPFAPSESPVDDEAVAREEGESLSHRDERQIMLDTDRSFVHYPSGEAPPLILTLFNAQWTRKDVHTNFKGRATQPRKK